MCQKWQQTLSLLVCKEQPSMQWRKHASSECKLSKKTNKKTNITVAKAAAITCTMSDTCSPQHPRPPPAPLSIERHHKCIMSSCDTFFDSGLQTASSRSFASRTTTSNRPEQMLQNIIMTRGKQSRLLMRKEASPPLSFPCRSSSLRAAVCCGLLLLTGERALTSTARQLDQEVTQRLLISDTSSHVSSLSSINRFFDAFECNTAGGQTHEMTEKWTQQSFRPLKRVSSCSERRNTN